MRARYFVPLACAALLCGAHVPATADDAGAHVTATVDAGRSALSFTSDAPTERILGTIDDITGTIVFDPASPETATGTIAFPVSSIRTGNSMRDRHVAGSDWLNAQSNPDVTFQLDRVTVSGQTVDGSRTDLTGTAHGSVTLNGVTQPIESPVTITLSTETQRLRVQLAMTVNLRSHEVRGRAGSIGREVAEDIAIDGTIYAGW